MFLVRRRLAFGEQSLQRFVYHLAAAGGAAAGMLIELVLWGSEVGAADEDGSDVITDGATALVYWTMCACTTMHVVVVVVGRLCVIQDFPRASLLLARPRRRAD